MKLPLIPAALRPQASHVQASTIRILPYWIAAAITALVSVLYARVFAWSEEVAVTWSLSHPLWSFLIVPIALLVSASLAHFFSPLAAGSGIPQLLVAVEVSEKGHPLLQKILGLRTVFIKMLGSCICVAGGGITGREGPMLQISAGIFHTVYKVWNKMFPQARNMSLQPMILAGGAAGLASAFNTPLGGVIFAIEELAKSHISTVRTYVFHAVIIAGLMAQAILGNYLYFGKIQLTGPANSEIIPLALASGIIGILGAIFGSTVVTLLDWRASLKTYQKFVMTAVGGIAVASFIYLCGTSALGSGRSVIVELLSHPDSPASLGTGAARGLGNLLTYSGGIIGGIFAPALSTGAALASWMSHLIPDVHSQVWILAGMVAFLTGVTRTPFTSLILVLEMTDTHNVIVSLMLAAIIAQSAAKLISPISFYEAMSYRILHGKAPEPGAVSSH